MLFKHIIAILYKILCQEGLRNKNKLGYDNFNLTNLAISLKYLYNDKLTKINIINVEEIAYQGLNIIGYMVNKYINKDSHIKYDVIYNKNKFY